MIPHSTLKSSQGQAPSTIKISKTFFRSHISDIKGEYLEVLKLGSATTEEWLKGLDERGKENRSDAARWERWESSGGISRMRMTESEIYKNKNSLVTANGFTPRRPDFLSALNDHATLAQAPGTSTFPIALGPPQGLKPNNTSFRK